MIDCAVHTKCWIRRREVRSISELDLSQKHFIVKKKTPHTTTDVCCFEHISCRHCVMLKTERFFCLFVSANLYSGARILNFWIIFMNFSWNCHYAFPLESFTQEYTTESLKWIGKLIILIWFRVCVLHIIVLRDFQSISFFAFVSCDFDKPMHWIVGSRIRIQNVNVSAEQTAFIISKLITCDLPLTTFHILSYS